MKLHLVNRDTISRSSTLETKGCSSVQSMPFTPSLEATMLCLFLTAHWRLCPKETILINGVLGETNCFSNCVKPRRLASISGKCNPLERHIEGILQHVLQNLYVLFSD